jgi:hypothetical protein
VPLNLVGVSGALSVSFWIWYDLENGYDGLTPQFVSSGGLEIVAPPGGWDIASVVLSQSCTWTDVTWPAWGQYTTTNPIGWKSVQFDFTRAGAPQFFHSAFEWRLYLETDGNTVNVGCHLDDLVIRVTQAP